MVFTAISTGGERRATSFQPFVGCVPTSGGGARGETSVKRASAFVPAKPIDRRVIRKRLVSGGSTRVVGRGPAGSRLLAADHASAFGSQTEPGTTRLGAVRVRRTASGRAVTAVARVAASVPQGLPVEFQLHALCTRVTR